LATKLVFWAQTTASFCKTLNIILVWGKIFAENWQKSQKNVIKTPTPDFLKSTWHAYKNTY
jgi:hypothetical protein